VSRQTLEDDTKGALADFLAYSVVNADNILSRTGAAVGVCGHFEADGEGRGRRGRGRGREREKGKRRGNMDTQSSRQDGPSKLFLSLSLSALSALSALTVCIQIKHSNYISLSTK
jgi:hypothetical protein